MSEPGVMEEAATEDKPLLDQKDGGGLAKKKREYSIPAVLLVFTFPALGGLLFGYDIGATSSVLVQLESSTYSGVTWYDEVEGSSAIQGVITSLGVGGAMVGSLLCFEVADSLGRRGELLVASALFLLGGTVEYLSGFHSWSAGLGITVLLLGRIIYGAGCGFAMHGAPAYIGEMSPPAIRGLLISLKEAMIVLGMLLGYFIGWLYQSTEGGWRSVYGLSSLLAIVMGVGCWYLPCSARWLVLKDQLVEARQSLKFVMPQISDEAVTDVLTSQNLAKKCESDWEALTNPLWRPALLAGVGLVILQQITGQPSVLYYANSLFEDVGMSNLSSVLIGLFKLVATLFAVLNVDRHGRKKLLLTGCGLMLVALMILGIAFCFSYTSESDCNDLTSSSDCSANSQCVWSSSSCSCSDDSTTCTCCGSTGIDFQKGSILTALFLYIGGYQVGFGPVVWLIIAEIFPLELRGKAISLAVVMNFFCNMVVTFLFPIEISWIGAAATFFIFAALVVYSLYFIYRHVVETKGLTLEQIEDLFRMRSATL